MRTNFIREKRYLCGEYMAVGLYSVTPTEHRSRGKKRKESSARQKAKNKVASMRRRQRVAVMNFTRRGFYVTLTYEDAYLPESLDECKRDAENYKRRVTGAVSRKYGAAAGRVKMMLLACRKGESGRLHIHGFVEVDGLGDSPRREVREMLEDLWRRRVPGGEYEPLGTANVDRIDMKKLLGASGEGKNGTMGYFYGHAQRRWCETKSLQHPEECAPNDSRWSRKQLRSGCADGGADAYWWEQRYPGYELMQCSVYDPGELYQTGQAREDGWEASEPQCYLILRRRRGYGAAKART